MHFHQATAELVVPDGLAVQAALARTTHLAVGAHQDDLEIMAAEAILACFQAKDRWFTGVIASDGRGSARDGIYKDYTDDEMRRVRLKEQRKAAYVGEYAAVAMLDYPSKVLKDGADKRPVDDLAALLDAARPEVVYTHNPADKHDTHVSVTLRVVEAIRRLPQESRPRRLLGCEVWRDLDWMVDADKVCLDVSGHENLHAALMGVFDSQIAGGKRYDLASIGRRRANATYFASHSVDAAQSLSFAMDLTALIQDDRLEAGRFVAQVMERFSQDVLGRLKRLGG